MSERVFEGVLEAAFQITGRGWVLAVQVTHWTGNLSLGDTLKITRPDALPYLCQIADWPQYPRFSPPRPNSALAVPIRGWTPKPSPDEWIGATVTLTPGANP